jgi:hypothetical protein
MPITYAVNTEQKFVHVTWQGDVTGEEYRAHLRKMLRDADALRAGRSLTDLRDANVLLSAAELNAIGSVEAVPLLSGRRWKTAVLVSSPLLYGLTRQYEILSQSEDTDCIFRDPDDALAWLLKDQVEQGTPDGAARARRRNRLSGSPILRRAREDSNLRPAA